MGHTDSPLSENGRAQCALLSERFTSVRLERLFSSPLVRARDTAAAAGKASGLAPEARGGLIEIDGGGWESVSWERIRASGDDYRLWAEEPWSFKAPGGESMTAVYERVSSEMESIAKECAGMTIAVVSHGCAIRNFMSYALGYGIEGMNSVPFFENTAVCKLAYDGGFKLLEGPDASHLPHEMLTMAHQTWWKTGK